MRGRLSLELDGYSLTEILLAILCASIVIAMTVPSLERSMGNWSLWSGTRLLESSLQWGRLHAITENTVLRFAVDPDARGFSWEDSESGERYEHSVRRLPRDVWIDESPRRSVRFYPRGNAAPAGTFVVRGPTGTYRVVINPGGRIRVQKG